MTAAPPRPTGTHRGSGQPKPPPSDGLWKRTVATAGKGLQLLWRLRLGWIAGHALLVVTHVGRRTGRHRRTVLYVQHYDRATREATVISVWGESQWIRNIRRRPAAQVEIALQRYAPEQRFLTTEEIFALEKRFRRRHRIIAWGQAKLMGWPWPATDAQLREISARMRAVAFHPPSSRAESEDAKAASAGAAASEYLATTLVDSTRDDIDRDPAHGKSHRADAGWVKGDLEVTCLSTGGRP